MIDKYLKVMADYTTGGLWHKDGTPLSEEEISCLPLTVFTKNRLKKWCEWYEENDDYSDESLGDFDYFNFAGEGWRIARRIKYELKDECEVWYFDEYALSKKKSQDKITFAV